MQSTLAEISLDALKNNLDVIKKKVCGKARIMAVVKADCYGHHASICLETMLQQGITDFGVATIAEAVAIRKLARTQNIAVLTPPIISQINQYFLHNVEGVISNSEMAKAFSSQAQALGSQINLHLMVDTGMGRNGCKPHETLQLLKQTKDLPNINIVGLCSHFATSDDLDCMFAKEQIIIFDKTLQACYNAGFSFRDVHLANSGGIFNYPDSHYNLVRAGLAMYGYHPTETEQTTSGLIQILNWKSVVSNITAMPANTPISYSRRYYTKSDTLVASVPIGYADGLMRALTNKLSVFINGKKYQVSGTICMDEILVDIGNDDVQVNDEVIITSPSTQTAWELASMANTIPYEVCTNISKRVERAVLKE